MPALLDTDECYRALGRVDITGALDVLDDLPYFKSGQSKAGMYQCDVCVSSQFPPEINALVASLGLGGELARAVIRKLAPGQDIPPHIDDWMPAEADWRRFQVPLVTDPRIIMRWPDDAVEVHLEAGVLYEVRFDRLHEVINGSDKPRIHLQIDQVDAP